MTNTIFTTTAFPIVEIFESLQGEGFNTGLPCIFVRLGKCNLACPWCDTNYNEYEKWSVAKILERVKSYSAKHIIITGGEPTMYANLSVLLDVFKAEGYWLAIETNGLKAVPKQIDYIATSPKLMYQEKYLRECISFANEVRIVVDKGDVQSFCEQIETQITAEHYYLSPCEVDGKMNLLETITQLGILNQRAYKPKWQLSLQTHKLVGIE
ncbi:7-carboxy-7-deazaguanine synthase QueE [Actinobacillus pleuropneumoniae]|uniref:7-carboxy-7-deazaguanine synthase QueE n=1 Tax=Actinobacillus pleuropneumoniae TaxID=715 RepID=UPI003D074BAC